MPLERVAFLLTFYITTGILSAMKYIIPVSWSMSHEFIVEANSLKEAIEISDRLPLPQGDFIDGSYEINAEVAEEINDNLTSEDREFLRNA